MVVDLMSTTAVWSSQITHGEESPHAGSGYRENSLRTFCTSVIAPARRSSGRIRMGHSSSMTTTYFDAAMDELIETAAIAIGRKWFGESNSIPLGI